MTQAQNDDGSSTRPLRKCLSVVVPAYNERRCYSNSITA